MPITHYLTIHFAPQTACVTFEIPESKFQELSNAMGRHMGVITLEVALHHRAGGAMMTETINHPIHYGGADNPHEVIKVLESWLSREEFIGFCKGNVIKYQARAARKAGPEDYAKAAWYAAYLSDYYQRTAV